MHEHTSENAQQEKHIFPMNNFREFSRDELFFALPLHVLKEVELIISRSSGELQRGKLNCIKETITMSDSKNCN